MFNCRKAGAVVKKLGFDRRGVLLNRFGDDESRL